VLVVEHAPILRKRRNAQATDCYKRGSRGSRAGTCDNAAVIEAELRPRLRGVFHQWAFVAAVAGGIVLVVLADGPREILSSWVYAGALAAMFGASALYHRFTWSQPTRLWLRRLDHAGIFGLIAGTYTPFGLLVLHGAWQKAVLVVVWSGAVIAIVTKLTWVAAPKWLSAIVGVASGGSAFSSSRRSSTERARERPPSF
jgi:hemolysin III